MGLVLCSPSHEHEEEGGAPCMPPPYSKTERSVKHQLPRTAVNTRTAQSQNIPKTRPYYKSRESINHGTPIVYYVEDPSPFLLNTEFKWMKFQEQYFVETSQRQQYQHHSPTHTPLRIQVRDVDSIENVASASEQIQQSEKHFFKNESLI